VGSKSPHECNLALGGGPRSSVYPFILEPQLLRVSVRRHGASCFRAIIYVGKTSGGGEAVAHRNRGGSWRIALILVLGIAAFAGFVLKRQLESPEVATEAGKADFRRYCAECHGSDGRGDGPRAEKLARRPADLTLLAARNGGTFRAPDIRDFIDGRAFEATHQDREMPIWGKLFNGHEDGHAADPESERRARIDHLVAYLWSLQRAPAPSDPDARSR